jgi:hypothetical protein
MKNPHTNQTSNALAVTSGNITRPPFDRQGVWPNISAQPLCSMERAPSQAQQPHAQ